MDNNKIARIFTMPLQFPCGPQSSCCGPVGQSEEIITALRNAIEGLGLEVEVHDIYKTKIDIHQYPQIVRLLNTFGPMALPVITVDNEVASMGNAGINDIVSAVKAKL